MFERPFNRTVVTKPMDGEPTNGPHFFEPIPFDWHTDPDYHDPKDDLFHVVDSKNAGEVLAIVVRVAGGFKETQANARLFAASWELRRALSALVHLCEVGGPDVRDFTTAVNECKALLARVGAR